MKYALGNMLNGAGGLNPDGLSLDLQFATDKTLTARKGPTPVFTRGSTGTFVGSNGLIQSAAINAARFDHDPVTLASRGLLIEESRTNLYLRSETFEDANWTKTRSSITVNATTAPDGTSSADKLVEDTSILSSHSLGSTATPPATSHTLSIFAKKGERDFIVLRLGGSNDFFNLNTGVALTSVNTPTITNFGNGWYRCTVTSAAGTQGSVQMSANGITTLYTGDGTSGIFIWGAQLEAGSFATSYIPTVASSVVRSADVCSITGGAFTGFYNNPAGTSVSEAMIANLIGNNRGIVQIDSGTTDNVIRHSYSLADGGFVSNLRANADTATTFAVVAGAASTIQKRAIAYEGTSFASATNGGSVATATRTFPVGLNSLRIGGLAAGGFLLNGHISSIRYFKKRLPNAKLTQLTT